MKVNTKTILCEDNNIDSLREQFPDGMHFVVGDTHGEDRTLQMLMEKIRFDPQKDHVFFVGDYNAGGNVTTLLKYIAEYYQADYDTPGFHLIRGNHERELGPMYPLQNLPDILVFRAEQMNYYIAHAGMISSVFDLINDDIAGLPSGSVRAYRLEDQCVAFDAPLRQIVWSRRGLYSQKSRWHNWPSEESLQKNRACIIHGHTPYCFFSEKSYSFYGDVRLFWQNQHIWFSEDLQSFNIDSNIKGRYENGESFRAISCLCLEVTEKIASQNAGSLTVEGICAAQNGVFSAVYTPSLTFDANGDISKLLCSTPKMKTITLDADGSSALCS